MLAGLDAIGGFVGTTSTSGGTGGSFVISVSPTEVSRSGGSRSGTRTLVTAPVTVTASGGAGGYTYAWSRLSGAAGITATSSTAATTTFSATLSPGDALEAIFACTVTDAAGAHLVTENVTVTISLEDLSGVGGTL